MNRVALVGLLALATACTSVDETQHCVETRMEAEMTALESGRPRR